MVETQEKCPYCGVGVLTTKEGRPYCEVGCGFVEGEADPIHDVYAHNEVIHLDDEEDPADV